MSMEELDKVRINKYLADHGHSTRRGADALIVAGKVTINGEKAVLGQKVGPDDKVKIKDKEEKSYRYLVYNKPAGYVTHSPVDSEKEIAEIFDMEGLFPIGRLDKNSEGLLILTNDGRITDRLLNPKHEHEKEYAVRVSTTISPSFAKKLEFGVDIGEGENTLPCKVSLTDAHNFTIALTEGKKHQIKRMTEALGVSVTNLKRLRIMNIKLGNLKPNTSREITGKELEKFLKSLGLAS
ncbi:MAG: rRNA pseudouridine synthase [Candidatus Taylorbacteria bacterium]|nr:rRNA pseudouridine synthase [Candidatus Taylorbacteria bacterium]